MSVDEAIMSALSDILPVYPNKYTGELLEYIVFDYTVVPSVFADRAPRAARYLVNIHHYLPEKEDPTEKRSTISHALFAAGFTWPYITNASDDDGQHYVFECEYVDGGDYYRPAEPSGPASN